jgi:hypothetical protein
LLYYLKYVTFNEHFWWRGEVCTGFWCGNLRERNYLEDQGIDGRIILKWIIRKCDEGHGLDRSGSG